MQKVDYKKVIRDKSTALGFFHCGFSEANFLEEEAPRLDKWLNNNYHGKMAYMSNHFDKRLDPRLLVDDAKTVVSLLLNYFPEEKQADTSAPKISKYAYGEDYHFVIKDKLTELLEHIKQEIGEVSGRVFVDSAPVMDKVWAKKSGLGWIGKHTNLIHPQNGSFFFIAELIIDLVIEPDGPIQDYCGTCTKCIDACPTEAIVQPYVVDGSKCISYFTIELKDQMPASLQSDFQNWIFGCDICQDVCPWNRFSKPHNEPRFAGNLAEVDWEGLSEEVFQTLFHYSAIKRTKLKGIQRNLDYVKKKRP